MHSIEWKLIWMLIILWIISVYQSTDSQDISRLKRQRLKPRDMGETNPNIKL